MGLIAGRYALEAEIGRGGMGAVWRGRDEVLGRTVALKTIGVAPGGLTPDALRAEREARLAAKLSHANVVAVFDLVSEDNQQWLVMEYVEGTDLGQMIRARGRLDQHEAAPILAQTAAALAAAHGAGIVHRDVKPSNILVTPSGQVKLSDFGIARTAADPSLTQTGLVTGSPAYLAPEVASGQPATPASDVWSWGATLFHALEGRTPYGAEASGDGNLLGVLYRIVHEAVPRPDQAGWLTPLVEGTMTRDVGQRWSMVQAQEFLEAGPGLSVLPVAQAAARTPTREAPVTPARAAGDSDDSTQLLPAGGDTAPRVQRPVAASSPPPRRGPEKRGRPWVAVVAAAVVLVALMAAALWVGLGRDDPADDTATDQPSTSPSPSGSTSPSESASPTGQPLEADAESMDAFVTDYITTAASDPEAAFNLLTPQFQADSGGLDGYLGFWDQVESATVQNVKADPDAMTVRYRYRYVTDAGPSTESVTLRLEFTDGQYLIAEEL